MKTLSSPELFWSGLIACFLMTGKLSSNEPICGKSTPKTVCPGAVEFSPCNQTAIYAQISGYIDAGSAGVNMRIWCPVLTYPNCPNGLKQSNVQNMNPETAFFPLMASGSVYIYDGELGPKVCYDNVPCRQTPEISTNPNNEDCFPCLIAPTTGVEAGQTYNEAQQERCGNHAWCVPAQNPPQSQIASVQSEKWDEVVLNEDCDEIYGPG